MYGKSFSLLRSRARLTCFGAGFLSLLLGSAAEAYVLEGPRWANNADVVMYLQLGSPGATLLDGSTSWNQVAGAALATWNPYLGSGVHFTMGTGTVAETSGDGKNAVFFSSTVFGQAFGSDTLAITQYYYTTRGATETFTEADVVFNSAVNFNSYRGDLRGGTPDLRRVAIHEFGHALGLGHVSQASTAIMTPMTTDLDTVQADDIAGVQSLYGSPQAHPAFFSGETALSDGVYYLAFANGDYFGYYSYLADPRYLYHFDLGYEYVFDAADGKSGVYLYDFASGSYFYTSPTFPFPYLYDFTLQTVIYYYPSAGGSGRYTTSPRYFFDFATGKVITK